MLPYRTIPGHKTSGGIELAGKNLQPAAPGADSFFLSCFLCCCFVQALPGNPGRRFFLIRLAAFLPGTQGERKSLRRLLLLGDDADLESLSPGVTPRGEQGLLKED